MAYSLTGKDLKLVARLSQRCQEAIAGIPAEHRATFLMLAHLPDQRKVLDLLYDAKSVFLKRQREHAATVRAIDVWIEAFVTLKATFPAEELGRRAAFTALLERVARMER